MAGGENAARAEGGCLRALFMIGIDRTDETAVYSPCPSFTPLRLKVLWGN